MDKCELILLVAKAQTIAVLLFSKQFIKSAWDKLCTSQVALCAWLTPTHAQLIVSTRYKDHESKYRSFCGSLVAFAKALHGVFIFLAKLLVIWVPILRIAEGLERCVCSQLVHKLGHFWRC